MPLFHFDAEGLLRADPNHPRKVTIHHLQTRRHKERRRTSLGQSAIEYIVNHITAFERKPQPIAKLNTMMQSAGLSPADQARLKAELEGAEVFSGALYQCLQNEADSTRQASWDFLVETTRDGSITVVQYNLLILGRYTLHAGPSKTHYRKNRAGKPVYNRDGTLVWDGAQFVYPGGANAKSIGIENSFYGGPLVREGDRIIYPFSKTTRIDITDESSRNGDIIEAEGRLFERALPVHMEVLGALNAALCQQFGIQQGGIMGHYHFDPMNRPFDPTFSIPIAELRAIAFGEPLPPTPPPTPERPLLRRGSRGDAVTLLQTALGKAEHAVEIDGIFGIKTEAAVRAFQRGVGLRVDGIVGPDTWRKLEGLGFL